MEDLVEHVGYLELVQVRSVRCDVRVFNHGLIKARCFRLNAIRADVSANKVMLQQVRHFRAAVRIILDHQLDKLTKFKIHAKNRVLTEIEFLLMLLVVYSSSYKQVQDDSE